MIKVGAIVLAAGAGTRLGQPKALVRARGRLLLARELERLHAAGVAPIAVILGAERERARTLLAQEAPALARAQDVRVIDHPAWELGQTSSLLVGLAALPATIDAFLIQPLDHAFVRPADLQALLAAAAREPHLASRILRPFHPPAAFGHPVLFGADYRAEFEALGERPAHEIARRHRPRIELVPVTNKDIAADVDTIEDLLRLEATLDQRTDA